MTVGYPIESVEKRIERQATTIHLERVPFVLDVFVKPKCHIRYYVQGQTLLTIYL